MTKIIKTKATVTVTTKSKMGLNNPEIKSKKKPLFGTSLWANKNANFIIGCKNDCKYCYAKAIFVRFKKGTPDVWPNEVVNLKKLKKIPRKSEGRIMFPSSHDISVENLDYSLIFLGNLLKNNNQVLIVTKPHLEVVKKICSTFQDKKNNILFRFTIGSANNETLKFWEPGATAFEERLESLIYAYNAGFETSVSCEPILDVDITKLIDQIEPYVTETIWIGKANMLLSRLKLNGITDSASIQKANDLLAQQSETWVWNIYNEYKTNPKIIWKGNIKKIVGI